MSVEEVIEGVKHLTLNVQVQSGATLHLHINQCPVGTEQTTTSAASSDNQGHPAHSEAGQAASSEGPGQTSGSSKILQHAAEAMSKFLVCEMGDANLCRTFN